MKKMYVVTMGFPYGKVEKSFLAPELEITANYFDITIVSVTSKLIMSDLKNKSELPDNVQHYVILSDINAISQLMHVIKSCFCITLYKDWLEIIKTRKNVVNRLLNSLKYHAKAMYYKKKIFDIIKKDVDTDEEFIVYTFWCFEPTLGVCFLQKKYKNMKIITRMLGGDLYNERREDGRQCFRSHINNYIHAIFFASENMMDYYLRNFHQNLKEKVCYIGRIGNRRQNILNPINKSDIFYLYSCSSVIPLKRVELIAKALGNIGNQNKVHWIHFGDGSEFNNLSKIADESQQKNAAITIELKGYTSREKIFKYLRENPIDCFITTTSTEGGEPLALVEALSFGIPIIATDVADISRTVQGNGVLLPGNPSVHDVTDAIKILINKDDIERINMRKASLEIWNQYFDEERLINKFIRDVEDL